MYGVFGIDLDFYFIFFRGSCQGFNEVYTNRGRYHSQSARKSLMTFSPALLYSN